MRDTIVAGKIERKGLTEETSGNWVVCPECGFRWEAMTMERLVSVCPICRHFKMLVGVFEAHLKEAQVILDSNSLRREGKRKKKIQRRRYDLKKLDYCIIDPGTALREIVRLVEPFVDQSSLWAVSEVSVRDDEKEESKFAKDLGDGAPISWEKIAETVEDSICSYKDELDAIRFECGSTIIRKAGRYGVWEVSSGDDKIMKQFRKVDMLRSPVKRSRLAVQPVVFCESGYLENEGHIALCPKCTCLWDTRDEGTLVNVCPVCLTQVATPEGIEYFEGELGLEIEKVEESELINNHTMYTNEIGSVQASWLCKNT